MNVNKCNTVLDRTPGFLLHLPIEQIQCNHRRIIGGSSDLSSYRCVWPLRKKRIHFVARLYQPVVSCPNNNTISLVTHTFLHRHIWRVCALQSMQPITDEHVTLVTKEASCRCQRLSAAQTFRNQTLINISRSTILHLESPIVFYSDPGHCRAFCLPSTHRFRTHFHTPEKQASVWTDSPFSSGLQEKTYKACGYRRHIRH
jgi:hypothetical protein